MTGFESVLFSAILIVLSVAWIVAEVYSQRGETRMLPGILMVLMMAAFWIGSEKRAVYTHSELNRYLRDMDQQLKAGKIDHVQASLQTYETTAGNPEQKLRAAADRLQQNFQP